MKKIKDLRAQKSIALVLALCLIMALFSILACKQVWEISEDSCFERLEDAVKQGASNVRVLLDGGEQRTKLVADLLSDHTVLDADTTKEYLDSIQTGDLISNYAVLLPDGQMVYRKGKQPQLSDLPDYASESAKSAYFMSRFQDTDGEEYTAYVCPITKNGTVRGVLYGYVSLAALPKQITFTAFGGESQMYLVDGDTGDFLVDTWHEELGNIFSGNLRSRKVKQGRTFEQSREDIQEGKPGYNVFTSETTGDDFYSFYYPTGKYNLSFQLTVPRSAAFANAMRAQRVVYVFCVVQILVILLFFVLFLRRVYRQLRQNRRKLEQTRLVSEMQRRLFGTYKNSYLINDALEQLSRMFAAQQVMFLQTDHGLIDKFYSWPVMDEEARQYLIGKNLQENFDELFRGDTDETSRILGREDTEEIRMVEEFFGMEMHSIQNIVLTCVLNEKKEVIGILHVMNTQDPAGARSVLELVAGGFQFAVQANDSYTLLKQMGTVDSLTGLQNRNAYQNQLAEYGENCERLGCIYIDANGLHDLNNQYGHEAGDAMLKAVANAICGFFDRKYAYRIGGDEFVVFCPDAVQEELDRRIAALKSQLKNEEYYASAGAAVGAPEQLLGQVIAQAEKAMYADKKAFYAGKKDRRGERKHNEHLENMLIEKKDMESFLSVISSNFLGVYIVNLDTDDTRCIFKPAYFAQILEENNYYFRSSIRQYAKYFIAKEDFSEFMKLLDYDRIAEKMNAGQTIECRYHKTDDTLVRVRILPEENYAEGQRNVLWIFEYDYVLSAAEK